MPDNMRLRRPQDSNRISLKEDYEKEYWKRKFRVSGQQLAGAVRAVGHSVKKVEAYLKGKD
jgi:Protein of unknown function (DUF3606)